MDTAPPGDDGSIVTMAAADGISMPPIPVEGCIITKRPKSRSSKTSQSETKKVDLIWTRDGRQCKLACTHTDDGVDPSDGGLMAWFYPPKNGKTVGYVCYYDGRVWQACYRNQYKTLEIFEAALGQDPELFEGFDKKRIFLKDRCREAGSRNIRISWSDMPERVVSGQKRSTVIEDAED